MTRSRSRSYSVDRRDAKRSRDASRSRSRSVSRSEYYLSSAIAPLLHHTVTAIDPEDFIRLRSECAELEQRVSEYQNELQVSQEVWYKQAEDFNSKLVRAGKTITNLLIDQAKREFVEMRKQLIANQERLGEYGIIEGTTNHRGWKGGSEDESITAAQAQYDLDKAEIDREKAASRKLRKSTISVIAAAGSNNNSNSGKENLSTRATQYSSFGNDAGASHRIVMDATETELLLLDTKESTSMAEAILKRTEEQIKERKLKLQADRISYMKQLKTHQAQDKSSFNRYERYGQMERYQLLNMLGKGGFSEVYKAYDLFTHCFVAIKIHQIHTSMDEITRQNYVQHTTMEYNIHKRLKHRRIVRLLDCFPIDVTSFGVAIEYCEGMDLDTYLKAHGPMTEKEARGVIVQVLSALRYLNTAPNKIIHYDLKPGNILYNKGSVKIADFGLSKIVDHAITNGHDTIELTSQGAGTYYYLPPECFSGTGMTNASNQFKVSNKVDVWSVGVVFYELIFGRKPFGDGQSQEHIMRSASTIFNPNGEIQFPGKISKQAEEFIRRLLTYDARRRPDVLEASVDPYVFPSAAAIGSMMVSSTPR